MILPAFELYDFFLTLGFIIQYFFLIKGWDSYDTCARPLNVWFIVDWTALIVTRIFSVLKATQYSPGFKKNVTRILYIICLPGLLGIAILGIIWQSTIRDETPDCVPKSMVPWSIYLWLVITCVVALYIFFEAVSDIYKWYQLRKMIQKLDEDMEEAEENQGSYVSAG